MANTKLIGKVLTCSGCVGVGEGLGHDHRPIHAVVPVEAEVVERVVQHGLLDSENMGIIIRALHSLSYVRDLRF